MELQYVAPSFSLWHLTFAGCRAVNGAVPYALLMVNIMITQKLYFVNKMYGFVHKKLKITLEFAQILENIKIKI